MSLEHEIVRALVDAGSGAVIALVMLVGLYRIVRGMGGSFIEAQRRQAEALGAQAQSVAGLTMAIQDFVKSDNTEHREMLLLLKLITQKNNSFNEVRSEHIKRRKRTRNKQAHPHCSSGVAAH